MKEKILDYLRAGYTALYAVSHEEERVRSGLNESIKKIKYEAWTWSITRGLVNPQGQTVNLSKDERPRSTSDPAVMLEAFCMHHPVTGEPNAYEGTIIPNKAVVMLCDFHLILKAANPLVLRLFKEAITIGRATRRHLVVTGCQLHLPPELEKDITVVEFPLPDRTELKEVAEITAQCRGVSVPDNLDLVLDAGGGMTTQEFADACSLSLATEKTILPGIVAKIKADTVKKNSILEIVEHNVTLDEIGGLDRLKKHLLSIRHSFTQEAKDYGLPSPRALLLCGNPGTGKSMGCTATKTVFGVPLVKLEAGRLFGSLVGESEGNWRKAFATVKAIAPTILWVDEVDGLFAGSHGQGDSGTTSRVVKAVIQDMQFNAEGIFFVFTANDIDQLPDPLIDRCDVWNVELPNRVERESIWAIHIAKRKRKPAKFDVEDFALKSDGFSGRQIEMAWIKAMTVAFNDKHRQPTNEDVIDVLKEFVPTSVTMAHAIERRRMRLKDCAQLASSPL